MIYILYCRDSQEDNILQASTSKTPGTITRVFKNAWWWIRVYIKWQWLRCQNVITIRRRYSHRLEILNYFHSHAVDIRLIVIYHLKIFVEIIRSKTMKRMTVKRPRRDHEPSRVRMEAEIVSLNDQENATVDKSNSSSEIHTSVDDQENNSQEQGKKLFYKIY